MNTLSATTSLLAHSLSWALLYSLWQGLLVCICLLILLKALPNINARIKYYLSFCAFSGVFLWFLDTWASEYGKLKGITVYITQTGAESGISTTYPVKAISSEQLQGSFFHNLLGTLEHYYPLIITLYIAGLALMLCRFAVNIVQLRALKTKGMTPAGEEWDVFVQLWKKQFNIVRPVQLYLSDRINVPMMLGVLKPVILLPIATINHLSTEQVEAILLHELAHIRRHDYLLNIIQTITETLLFFNPFVWIISGIIRREREHCCDDLVVSYAASPLPYAHALTILEDHRLNDTSLALAATGHKNQLFHRIKRIMEMKRTNINYSQLTIIVVAFIAITFTAVMFAYTPSFAQKLKGDKSDSTKTKSSYTYKSVTTDANGNRTVVKKRSTSTAFNKDMNNADQDADANVSMNDDAQAPIAPPEPPEAPEAPEPPAPPAPPLPPIIDEDAISITVNGIKAAVLEALAPLADMDMSEINKEMEEAGKDMHAIDWSVIRDQINEAVTEVNKELNNAKTRKYIDAETRKELEHSKAALATARKELAKHRKEIGIAAMNAVDEARAQAAEARREAQETAYANKAKAYAQTRTPHIERDEETESSNDMEGMLKAMEREKLIDRKQAYKVEKDENGLYINGQKQPIAIAARYNHYLDGKKVSINGSKNSTSISVETH